MPQATKETFARALEALVRKYKADRDTYLSSEYNEAQTRTQFISPLLEALGWDVRNEAGAVYHLCEVWEEKGETRGRPDYTLRIDGQTKFFLEAKSPSPDPLPSADILQTKRYAWNSGGRDVFFAALSNFEEFRFYDASLQPSEGAPRDGEAFHLIYTEYSPNVDKLWELSRERVAAGSLDQFLRKDRKSIRQRVPPDQAFLDSLTEWRHELANAVFAKKRKIEAIALNDIVQRLLDRLVFIRIAEDRNIIEPRELGQVVDTWEESGGRRKITDWLVALFREINERFNGEIFKPHPCEDIEIESHVLAKIIRQLYPPKSNYRFDVIGVELLGSAYERYLGNTLRITSRGVDIEPKPEVRKAGGVYYTPQYIVDYIVKNTVGKLVEGKTPKEADKIRILDPACGSGSFLIGAFQFLIDWYLSYYREHPKEARVHPMYPETHKDLDGNLRLSFHAKKRILVQNLYGVDIDQQAVEITMMSLYLKMLEGERGFTIPKQDKLPELKYNIRCGNSLVSPDIENESPLTSEERQRINPFNWNSQEEGFGDILKSGGFDAVIGNPPYLGGREWKEEGGRRYDYLIKHFEVAEYQFDIYTLFWERGIRLLKRGGWIGFITPNTWLNNRGDTKLRQFILHSAHIASIADYSRVKVFSQAVVLPIITVLQRNGHPSGEVEVYVPREGRMVLSHRIPQERWDDGDLRIFNIDLRERDLAIRGKIEGSSVKLESLAEVRFGVKLYETGKGAPPQRPSHAQTHAFEASKKLSPKYRRYLEGKDVNRYEILWKGRWLKYGHNLAAPRDSRLFEGERLLVRRIVGQRLIVAFTDEDYVTSQLLQIVRPNDRRVAKYLLGVLNSSTLAYYFKKKYNRQDKTFPEIRIYELASLPVRLPDLSKPVDKGHYDGIVKLVNLMLELNKRKHESKPEPAELDHLNSQIAATEVEIDNLVYEIYGITDEERKIIEAGE